MSARSRLAAAVACLAVLAGGLTAQVSLHHGFPVAGEVLALVVDGAAPDEPVDLRLERFAEAPPSLVERLLEGAVWRADGEALVTTWVADRAGQVRLDVLLDAPEDAGSPVVLSARSQRRPDEVASAALAVVPPIVVVDTGAAYERIDLRRGARLVPPIPRADGLRGLAVSDDGTESYALYADGRLETWPGQTWTPAPSDVVFVDPGADGLAAVPQGGLAFVLVRSGDRPFSPSGRLVFPEELAAPLVLEPMGEAVEGRRWAVSEDGLLAFVAEDYLTVRQVDLLHREAGAMFTAGRGGDSAIADLALDAGRLYVATSSVDERPGSLTVHDLRSGITDVVGLSIQPQKVVVLDEGAALVVPDEGERVEVFVDGVAVGAMGAEGGAWLDAAAVPGAALLLRRDADGRTRLLRYDVASGVLASLAEGLPPVTRVVTRRHAVGGHAVLLGDPSGTVWSYDRTNGAIARVPDVSVVDPAAPSAQLP